MSNNEQERKPQMCELKMPIEAVMTAIPTGWKITQVCSDDYLLGKFGFTHTVKEHRRDVYTKIVEREVRGGVKITERAYVLEIRKRTDPNDILAKFEINGRSIFSMQMSTDYSRARHVAIKAVVAWCKKSWRNAGV